MVASGTGSEEPEYECISWFIIIVRHPSFILLHFLFLFLFFFFLYLFLLFLPSSFISHWGNVDFSHDEQLRNTGRLSPSWKAQTPRPVARSAPSQPTTV